MTFLQFWPLYLAGLIKIACIWGVCAVCTAPLWVPLGRRLWRRLQREVDGDG